MSFKPESTAILCFITRCTITIKSCAKLDFKLLLSDSDIVCHIIQTGLQTSKFSETENVIILLTTCVPNHIVIVYALSNGTVLGILQ